MRLPVCDCPRVCVFAQVSGVSYSGTLDGLDVEHSAEESFALDGGELDLDDEDIAVGLSRSGGGRDARGQPPARVTPPARPGAAGRPQTRYGSSGDGGGFAGGVSGLGTTRDTLDGLSDILDSGSEEAAPQRRAAYGGFY